MPDFKSMGKKTWKETTVRILRATVALLKPPMGKQGEML